MASKMEDYTKPTAGNFLSAQKAKANNLTGKVLTIKEIAWQEVGDITKPILSFVETDLTLALNKGNAAILTEAYGKDESAWSSKKIQLVITKKQYQGQYVDGITVVAVLA